MNIEKALIGLEKIENNYTGWDSYFHKRRNNPYDVSWGDLCLNKNAPYNTDVCFILTSYWKHLRFLKASLLSYRQTGKFVIVGYDNPFKPWDVANDIEMNRLMPRREHYQLAHSIIIKHITYDSDKRFGSFWDMKYAQGIANLFNFKYVWLGTTDCVFDKPEGVDEMISILGDGDLMAVSSSSTPHNTGSVHSNSVLFKREAFNKVVDYMYLHFETPLIGYGCKNLDKLLAEAIIANKLKETIAPKQPIYPLDDTIDHYCCYGQTSTWQEVMGFHNLFAEYITASEERLEPPNKKYIDDYKDYLYFDDSNTTIVEYYRTGDRRYLYQWWDMYCLPETNRKYLSLTSYGLEPIYGIN